MKEKLSDEDEMIGEINMIRKGYFGLSWSEFITTLYIEASKHNSHFPNIKEGNNENKTR